MIYWYYHYIILLLLVKIVIILINISSCTNTNYDSIFDWYTICIMITGARLNYASYIFYIWPWFKLAILKAEHILFIFLNWNAYFYNIKYYLRLLFWSTMSINLLAYKWSFLMVMNRYGTLIGNKTRLPRYCSWMECKRACGKQHWKH